MSLPSPAQPQAKDITIPKAANPALAAAVLRQAHADATKTRPARPGGWSLTYSVRRDALRFIFSGDEYSTYWREYWCGQAGIHPDKLRWIVKRDIIRLLTGGKRVSRTGAVEGGYTAVRWQAEGSSRA